MAYMHLYIITFSALCTSVLSLNRLTIKIGKLEIPEIENIQEFFERWETLDGCLNSMITNQNVSVDSLGACEPCSGALESFIENLNSLRDDFKDDDVETQIITEINRIDNALQNTCQAAITNLKTAYNHILRVFGGSKSSDDAFIMGRVPIKELTFKYTGENGEKLEENLSRGQILHCKIFRESDSKPQQGNNLVLKNTWKPASGANDSSAYKQLIDTIKEHGNEDRTFNISSELKHDFRSLMNNLETDPECDLFLNVDTQAAMQIYPKSKRIMLIV